MRISDDCIQIRQISTWWTHISARYAGWQYMSADDSRMTMISACYAGWTSISVDQYRIQDSEAFRTKDLRSSALDPESRIRGAGLSHLDPESCIQDPGLWTTGSRYCLQDVHLHSFALMHLEYDSSNVGAWHMMHLTILCFSGEIRNSILRLHRLEILCVMRCAQPSESDPLDLRPAIHEALQTMKISYH